MAMTRDDVAATSERHRRLLEYLQSLNHWQRRLALAREKVPERLPRFVYKYRAITSSDTGSIDRLRSIVVGSQLWLSSPADFNDPFDMSAKVLLSGGPAEIRRRLGGILRARGFTWIQSQEKISEYMRSGINAIEENIQREFASVSESHGVCSFAGDPRSILMWSHYAANHEGICLQFEVARDLQSLVPLPVRYDENYPSFDWIGETDKILEVLLTKYQGWSYEKEHRIILARGARQQLKFRAEALVGLLLGCRLKDDSIAAIKSLLNERTAAGLPELKVYDVFKDKSSYALKVYKSRRI